MVAKGYKQTEIGVIPEDWSVVRMGEIGENIAGLTYSPNDVSEYGTLVLRSSNIQNNKLAYDNNVFVKMDLPSRVIVKENDLLICVRNGSKRLIGKCTLIDEAIAGNAFGAFMSVYRSVHNKFIFQMFQSNIILQQIDETMGATINQLTNKDLSGFKVPIPPKQEQEAIATALSDADALIDALEKLIAKKEAIKTGTMQELLTGKKRLDGFSGEWVERKLGDIVHVVSGGTPSTTNPSYWDGTINWYTPTEIGKNKYVTSSLRRLTDEGYQNSSAKILPIGAILFTSRAGIGDTSILLSEGCTNQGFQSLVAKTNIDNEFVYYLISILKNKFLQNASGSTFLEISPNKVREIEVFIPAYQEQRAIATILSDIDKEIEALKSKLSKVKVIKEGMMQELLTGKTRLLEEVS